MTAQGSESALLPFLALFRPLATFPSWRYPSKKGRVMKTLCFFIALFFLGTLTLWAQGAQVKTSTQTMLPPVSLRDSVQFIYRPIPPDKYQEPSDLIDLVPVLRDINAMIPRRFSLFNHQVTLNSNEMVVKNYFLSEEQKRVPKNSVIFLGYDDLGERMDTYFEMPLFYSSETTLAGWTHYPLGNYSVRMMRAQEEAREDRLYLKARVRF